MLQLKLSYRAEKKLLNEQALFKGEEKVLYNDDGTIASWANVSINDIKFADYSLCGSVFSENTPANYYNFSAVIDKPGHGLDGTSIDAIYGRGSTSRVSAKISYMDDNGVEVKKTIDLSNLPSSDFTTDGSKCEKFYDYSDGVINLRFREFAREIGDKKMCWSMMYIVQVTEVCYAILCFI